MADLYNLLPEIDEPQEQGQHEQLISVEGLNVQNGQQQQDTSQEGEEWDDVHREVLDLPPALREAEERKLQRLGATPETEATTRADLEDFSTLFGSNGGVSPGEGLAAAAPTGAYDTLKTLWTQEIHAPELLPYDQETIQSLTVALHQQEDRIERLMSEGESGNANMDSLLASILKIDADRVKFLLCDLFQQRLRKIELYPLHMRQHVDRMSPNEVSEFEYIVLRVDVRFAALLTSLNFLGCLSQRIRGATGRSFASHSFGSSPPGCLEKAG